MEGIQLSVKKTGVQSDISVIKVGGYIDTTTSAELEHSLESLLKAGCYNIIIDLADVDYISSAGWGIFISEIKGIREKGGDLKLVRMIPDVYEVFELLEFHYILKAFDTIEEAVEDFDKNRGVVSSRAREGIETEVVENPIPEPSQTAELLEKEPLPPSTTEEGIEDMIRKLVIENPQNGSIKIMRELNTDRFGHTKLNWFQVRRYLKKLGLDTKKKRIAFFKEATFS